MYIPSARPDGKEMLRIALVGPLPPPFGGMANQTEQLAHLLTKEGIVVEVVQTNCNYPNQLISKIRGIRALFRLVPYLFKLLNISARVDCFHVMANSGWSWQLFAAPAIWIGWLKKVPVIVNYRGGEAEQYFQKSIQWVAPTLMRSAAVVVPSGFLKDVFNKYGFSAKVIPNIINRERFVFTGRTSIQNQEAPCLVVARNLEAIYGIDTAIKAIAILRKSIPKIKLFIAGSGPLLATLEQLVITLDLSNNVQFTGKLAPDGMAKLYATMDIMLNPTRVDNMPNSILEALSCGLPVVTTNVGGIPHIVKDNETALMVDIDHPEMMADRVMELVSDQELYKRLIINGLKCAEKYAWDNVKNDWITLYEQVKVKGC